MTVAKAVVPGLTLDNHRIFRENLPTQLTKIGKNITITECPDINGHYRCLLQEIKMPMMMSNRSVVQVYYLIENCDAHGSMIFISSSRSTDDIVAAQSAKIKKNVIANNIINYMKLTPTETGCCNVETVLVFDIAGSMPDSMKRKGADT